MSEKLDKISEMIRQGYVNESDDRMTVVLKQIIKIERDCLYGEKSSYGKKKEVLALITRHAHEESGQ